MTRSLRRAGLLLFGVAAIAVIVWNLIPAGSSDAGSATSLEPPSPPSATVPGRNEMPAAAIAAETRDYAIALDELQGFAPDLPPGTRVELWVSWDRPSGATPKLQRLVPIAELVRVVPPSTPGGPTAVVLRVPIGRIPSLLWADGYGALSVTVIS